jgi:hypothetical protein
MPPTKRFECVTTAQVERTYIVEAKDEDQARARLKTHMKDSEQQREGIVEKLDMDKNTTTERITRIKTTPGVRDATPPEPSE